MPSRPAEAPATYSAFISYRHVPRDTAWAKWLLEVLETYRTPRALQKTGVPARLKKLFRDEDEIPASSDLSDQIAQALEASEYLIVVCSSDTPASLWVDKEIETFHRLGRSTRILALLVEGEPDDAFPKLLLRECDHVDAAGTIHWKDDPREPIAADVRPRAGTPDKVLKQNALLRIAATLLGVRFDDLRQRDLQRTRARQRSLALVSCAALLLTALGGFLWWDNTRLKVADFANYTTRHMLPEGITPLTADQVAARGYRYRIERRGGKVRRMRLLNSAGNPAVDFRTEQISTWAYFYRDDRLESARLTDKKGALVRIERYETSADGREVVVVFRAGNGRAYAQNAATDQLRVIDPGTLGGRTTITQNRLVLNDAGLVTRRQFEDFYGTPRADAAGIYGKAYTHDDRGLVIGEQFLDSAWAPAAQRNGLAQLRYGYSDMGELTELTSLDLEGRPVLGDSGHARARYLRDANGNYAGGRYFGPDDRPITVLRGFAGHDVELNAQGLGIRDTRYDENGDIALGNRDDVAVLTYDYDAAGNVVANHAFDAKGARTLSRTGQATTTFNYDAQNRVVAIGYFDTKGDPVLNTEGLARVEIDYDSESRIIENRFYGTDGLPTRRKDYAAREVYTFDAAGHLVMTEFFDTDGSRQRVVDGNAIRKDSYDGRGNVTRSSFFDEDGAPTSGIKGFATMTRTYDQQGRMIRQEHLGPDDTLVIADSGVAAFEKDYDDKGNKVQQRYYDHMGRLHLKGRNYAAVNYRHDAQGNEIEWTYLDATLQPGSTRTGVQTVRQSFDAQGRVVRSAQYGADGELIADTNGIAIYENTYDRAGRITSLRYFDATGARGMGNEGYSRSDTDYDAKGNAVARRRYDTQDELTMTPEGWAQVINTYDARGNWVDTQHFDAQGDLVLASKGHASLTNTHDARGNLIEQAFFDTKGAPMLQSDGVARLRNTFNAAGQRILQEYFGVDGEPVLNNKALAVLATTYDSFGNVLTEAHLGVSGEPVIGLRGFHKLKITRDALGRKMREEYLGTDGEPVSSKSGLSAIDRRHDIAGNIISFAQWKWDEVANDHRLFFRAEFEYDALNNVVDERAFDADGQPRRGLSGYHRNTNTYDGFGRLTRRDYWDVDGTPVRAYQGFATVETAYTAQGEVAEVRRFGPDGALTSFGTGAAIERFAHDAQGNIIERSYFGTDARPILKDAAPIPHARIEADYNARGHWTQKRQYGISEDGTRADVLLLTTTRTLDALGRDTRQQIVDPTGALGDQGALVTASRYDAQGRRVEMRGLDAEGTPAPLMNGAYITRSTYDDRGRLVATRHFDADDQPMISRDGFATRTQLLDARGNLLEKATFGADGTLLAPPSGYAREVRVYNALDQIIERTYYDANNDLVTFQGGFNRYRFTYAPTGEMLIRHKLTDTQPHRVAEHYDPAGRITATEWQDAAGALVDIPGQFTRIAYDHDARGNRTRVSTFNAAGAPMAGAKGYAVQTMRYTPNNLVEEQLFFDTAGAPVVTTDGFAGTRYAYDAQGRSIRNLYLGVDGKPMNGPQGYARFETTYAADNTPTLQVYYDAVGVFVGHFSVYATRLQEAFAAKDRAAMSALLEASITQHETHGLLDKGTPAQRARLYLNAAWYAVFSGDPAKGEGLAHAGVALTPDDVVLQTNLAHALMLQNRVEEARRIYLAHRGAPMPGDQTWEPVILDDFAKLQDHGLTHPLMDEITAAFAAEAAE